MRLMRANRMTRHGFALEVGLRILCLAVVVWFLAAALALMSFDPPTTTMGVVRQATNGFVYLGTWVLMFSPPAVVFTAWFVRRFDIDGLMLDLTASAAILGFWWAFLAIVGLFTVFSRGSYGLDGVAVFGFVGAAAGVASSLASANTRPARVASLLLVGFLLAVLGISYLR